MHIPRIVRSWKSWCILVAGVLFFGTLYSTQPPMEQRTLGAFGKLGPRLGALLGVSSETGVKVSVLPTMDEADTADLERGLRRIRNAEKDYSLGESPLAWANYRKRLGQHLRVLGERESGTARLEEALAIFYEVREIFAREISQGWPEVQAKMQMEIGIALRALGERESDTLRLEKAIEAHRAALEVFQGEGFRASRALTLCHLGRALYSLDALEPSTERLREAIAAYREALPIFGNRPFFQSESAMCQKGLRAAEQALSQRREP